jgi:fermentation-respiration switch protein FrsA (DUF1100 family)
MVHGTDDQLVPAEMLGRLSKAASSKATVVPIAGAGHNDIFDRGGENLDKKIAVFTNRSTAHPRE